MANAYISSLKINNESYSIKDAEAREELKEVKANLNIGTEAAEAAEANAKAYTESYIANLMSVGGDDLDTFKEITDAIVSNADAVDTLNEAIAKKVSKVEGKGLSTNDFTNEYKNDVDNLKRDIIVGIQKNGTDLQIDTDKKVNIEVPTVSDIYSDTSEDAMSGKAVASAISTKQDTLETQTAYEAKGTTTKIPQITTNELGQVTNITEVDIEDSDIIGISTTSILENSIDGNIVSLKLLAGETAISRNIIQPPSSIQPISTSFGINGSWHYDGSLYLDGTATHYTPTAQHAAIVFSQITFCLKQGITYEISRDTLIPNSRAAIFVVPLSSGSSPDPSDFLMGVSVTGVYPDTYTPTEDIIVRLGLYIEVGTILNNVKIRPMVYEKERGYFSFEQGGLYSRSPRHLYTANEKGTQSSSVDIPVDLLSTLDGSKRDELIINLDGTGQYIKNVSFDRDYWHIFELDTPIVRDLTSLEIQNLLALKTFSDKTIFNADGADCEVGYFKNTTLSKTIRDFNKNKAQLDNNGNLDVYGEYKQNGNELMPTYIVNMTEMPSSTSSYSTARTLYLEINNFSKPCNLILVPPQDSDIYNLITRIIINNIEEYYLGYREVDSSMTSNKKTVFTSRGLVIAGAKYNSYPEYTYPVSLFINGDKAIYSCSNKYNEYNFLKLEKYGGLSSNGTPEMTIALSGDNRYILFTNEYNYSTSAYRGHHAYHLYNPSSNTTQTVKSVNLGASSSTGVTVTFPASAGTITIKPSSTVYGVRYTLYKMPL